MASYSSIMLKSIGKISKVVTNYHLSSLNNTIRIKIISLGIRKQRNTEPYRRSRGGRGSFFHKINTIVGWHNDWRHLNICSSKTPRSIDYRNILTVQQIDTKIKSMCESQIHCALINCSNLIYTEPMQELPVIITDHIHSITSWNGVEDDNLVQINPQQTVPNQIPNRISQHNKCSVSQVLVEKLRIL